VNCGSGPSLDKTRPRGRSARLLARHHGLTAMLARHNFSARPRDGEFLGPRREYYGVYLDTTMAFNDFFGAIAAFSPVANNAADATRRRQGSCGHRLSQLPTLTCTSSRPWTRLGRALGARRG